MMSPISYYDPIINATGVVLHTGFGRAPLPASVRQTIDMAAGYVLLEVEREDGERGERIAHLSQLLAGTTGANAGLAVNNNAAAVLLALAAVVDSGKVITAHGHLVEIGGSFRLHEVFTQSGCELISVGTANFVRLEDYQTAITKEIRAIFVAHHSNFWFEGEFAEVSLASLADLAHQHNLPLIYDLGTGAMFDLSAWGVTIEMTVHKAIKSGADIVCFSGDKLFGGPQAGLVVGHKEYLSKMLHHPLYRALRLDKTILAGLSAMLEIYRQGEDTALKEIPTLRMLTEPSASIKSRAQKLLGLLPEPVAHQCRLAETVSKPGGGTLPQVEMPSWALAIRPQDISLRDLARRLRMGEPSVWGRLSGKDLWLDIRTVAEEEVRQLAGVLSNAIV